MPFRTISLILAGSIAAAGPSRAAEDDEGGYWALFEDGKEVAGSRVRDWHYRERRATLSGRRLFDPKSHVRVLSHTAKRPGGRGPRVFLANGDVLPGRVVAFGAAEPRENLPDRLAVAPSLPLAGGAEDPSDGKDPARGLVEVRADAVTQAVFGNSPPRPHRGGAVFLADGSAFAVSSVRWTAEGLKALGPERIIAATFQELAEVHLPKADPTAAVLADARLTGGEADDWIARLETESGAVLTYLVAVRESRSARRRNTYDTFHMVQPAWALTPIAVPEGDVCIRTYRRATEVPLSLLDAETLAERSFTGFLWPWRRHRNVRGDLLRCGSVTCGLGFGTHSYSEVAFALPPGAKTFSGSVGLDRAVGPGGCTRLEVRQDSAGGKPLWRSGLLIGTNPPQRIGPIAVDKARRLVFVTDFAHDDRPRGADPGDIRDEVNWLMPTVTIDPAVLRIGPADVTRFFPTLDGWTLGKQDLAALEFGMVNLSRRPWEPAMHVPAAGLTLARTIKPSPAQAFLEVAACRGDNDSDHVIEVLVDGRPIKGFLEAQEQLHTFSRGMGDAMVNWWLLMPHRGKTVTLTVKVTRGKVCRDTPNLLWRSLSLLPLVRGLPPDGQCVRPDVFLRELKPTRCVWFNQKKDKREEPTVPPAPATADIHGLDVPHSLAISQGMQLTYELKPIYRRFVAVVHSENPYHRGPMVIRADDKELWRSDESFEKQRWPVQVVVDIPRGAKELSLVPEHNMTSAVWGMAGFLVR